MISRLFDILKKINEKIDDVKIFDLDLLNGWRKYDGDYYIGRMILIKDVMTVDAVLKSGVVEYNTQICRLPDGYTIQASCYGTLMGWGNPAPLSIVRCFKGGRTIYIDNNYSITSGGYILHIEMPVNCQPTDT